ncbi:putative integral membrane protein [unidentified eubacterium SCB49]|nr:putative integral membrane protein [unidentified eubacterium SCB49]
MEEHNDIKVTPNGDEFEHIKLNAWESIKQFFVELFDIQSDTDRDATIAAVKKDISFKGHTAWILIFSIFIASIGLNVSSTAVVIGAMLISPLMGPIVGIGLSLAINDIDTMKRSFTNLGVMVILSVLTATLYFWLSPLTEETAELVARTAPNILDVLVAIFGGLGLIVAKTKSGTIASVILGVAIATALMPPLCTVGYGLAIGNLSYAGGAMYLFSINAVFIALATFIVAKVLRFPMVRYANTKRRKMITRLVSLVALVVIVPSIYLFVQLLEKQVFTNKVNDFVKTELNYEGAEIVKTTQDYESKDLEVYLIGKPVPQSVIDRWVEKIKDTETINEVDLRIYQGADNTGELKEQISGMLKADILSELYINNEQKLSDKAERITFLENEVAKLTLEIEDIPFVEVSEEIKAIYADVETVGYSRRIQNNFKVIDTLPVFTLNWANTVKNKDRIANNKRIASLLKVRLKLDTLKVE